MHRKLYCICLVTAILQLLNTEQALCSGLVAKTRGDSLIMYTIGNLTTLDFREYGEQFRTKEDRVFSGELISVILNTKIENNFLYYVDRGNGLSIPASAYQNSFVIDSARIEGDIGALDRQIEVPLRLTNSVVTGRIEFARCELSKSISIYNTTVDGGISISACEANEDVTFSFVISPRLDVRDFSSNKSINVFEGKFPFINLQSIKVAQNVSLQVVQSKDIASKNSQVAGDFTFTSNDTAIQSLDLSYSHIGGNLYINTAGCTNLSMRSIRCESPAQIGIRHFVKDFDLKGAMLKELSVYGEFGRDDSAIIEKVNMARCTTIYESKFDRLVINDFRAEHSVWRGEANFVSNMFKNKLYFRNSSFSSLVFYKCVLPIRDNIDFSEAKFELLPLNTEWNTPFWIAESTAFRPSIYLELENYFNEIGETELADKVYVLRKDRTASQRGGVEQFWSWVFKVTAGYGRYLRRTLYLSLACLGIGLLLFSRSNMTYTRDEGNEHRFNRFWFTIELFIPVINLRLVEGWIPRKPRATDSFINKRILSLAYHYTKILPIVGFIIVTLLAAVVAGIIVRN